MGSSFEEKTGKFSVQDVLQRLKELERPRSAALICIAGLQKGRVFALGQQEVVLGRGNLADLQFEDEGISRRHARVFPCEGAYMIDDLGSCNGTVCNDRVLAEPEPLADGTRIGLGPHVVLCFGYQDAAGQEMQSKLYELATRDPLTGAYNRWHLMDRLPSEWTWALRHGRPCGLLALDVDHFKRVNDSHGHAGGDLVLKDLAATVQREIRREDLLARTGGEEFVVLARSTGLEQCRVLAERLRKTVEGRRIRVGMREVSITLSLGIATSSDPGVGSTEELLRRADEHLYRAKAKGRNRTEP